MVVVVVVNSRSSSSKSRSSSSSSSRPVPTSIRSIAVVLGAICVIISKIITVGEGDGQTITLEASWM